MNRFRHKCQIGAPLGLGTICYGIGSFGQYFPRNSQRPLSVDMTKLAIATSGCKTEKGAVCAKSVEEATDMADRSELSNSCGVAKTAAPVPSATIKSSAMHSNASSATSLGDVANSSRNDLNLIAHLHSGKKIRIVNFYNIDTRWKNGFACNDEDGKALFGEGLRDLQLLATSPVNQLAELFNGSLPSSQPDPSKQKQ